MTRLLPETEADAAEAVRAARGAGTRLALAGAGTKSGMLRPVAAAATLSAARLTGVRLYSPSELVLGAGAGTRVAALEATLAEARQHLIAEPPDYAHLFGTEPAAQTLGGIVAANLSGPRRIAAGALRDHVLGVRAVTGVGEIVKSGGRVLKNVTGLDFCKLFAGSFGTLAFLTEITLKVLPAPETSASVVLPGLGAEAAVAALAAGLGAPFGVSGAAHLPAAAARLLGADGALTLLRIEDFADSVAYRGGRLAALLAAHGAPEIWPEARSRAAWAAIRDARVLAAPPEAAIWRVSVRPAAGPGVLAAAERVGVSGYLDWGGGLLMLAGPATAAAHAAIAGAATGAGGTFWLMRAPAAWRATVAAVPAEPAPLAALTARLKHSFDPAGIFSPGRVFAGV